MKKRKLMAAALAGVLLIQTAGCTAATEENVPEEGAVSEDEATEGTTPDAGDAATGFNGDMVGQKAEKKPATLEDNDAANASPYTNAVNAEASEDDVPKTGDVLVDVNFDDGEVDDFTVYTNGGFYDLSNTDGALDCFIHSCGSVDYGNQAYWDGFKLVQGCEYTYSFDVSSDINRKMEYRLQINGGDYHAYQGEYIEIGPDVTSFSVDFTMEEASDPSPRIVFNMGKMDDMASDPGDHHIYIDNVKLVVKNADNAQNTGGLPAYLNVNIDQVGYTPDSTKTVFVKTENDNETFYVCDVSSETVIYQGTLSETIEDKAAGAKIAKGDFSEVTEPGEYYIYTESGATYTFKIGEDVYDDLMAETVLMFYRQRCGVETDAAISGAEYAHAECHMDKATVYGTNEKVDVSGGWHDAGDYGRYIVSGAKSVADLLDTYTYNGYDADNLGIPESGNGVPDVLDEARFELDWMLKMQNDEGGVYHKVTAMVFPGAVPPEEETDELILSPVSITATADFAAVMAMASVVYKDIDPEFAQTAYDAAVKSWEYAVANKDAAGFKNPDGMETGEYPDGNAADEIYWAAVELYIAEDLYTAPETDPAETIKAVSDMNEGLGWADMGLYAEYDLAMSGKDGASDAAGRLMAAADEIAEKSLADGYYMGLMNNYPWGSNMTVANNGVLFGMAADVAANGTVSSKGYTEDDFKALAETQLDYLLGANPLGYCYVTGFGIFTPADPHHRPSQVAGAAMPGMLVGGPASGLEDPYAASVLADQPAAMCYVDNVQSYSTNEVTIYWNSPLVYLLTERAGK